MGNNAVNRCILQKSVASDGFSNMLNDGAGCTWNPAPGARCATCGWNETEHARRLGVIRKYGLTTNEATGLRRYSDRVVKLRKGEQ